MKIYKDFYENENNQAYYDLKKLLAGDKVALEKLLTAESSWQANRDEQCSLEKQLLTEKDTSHTYAPCVTSLTIQPSTLKRCLGSKPVG